MNEVNCFLGIVLLALVALPIIGVIRHNLSERRKADKWFKERPEK